MFSQITIPDSEVIWAIRLVIGYIVAAIMWGVRVEMRLAALAREDKAQLEASARNEKTMHEAILEMRAIKGDVAETKNDVKWIREKLK